MFLLAGSHSGSVFVYHFADEGNAVALRCVNRALIAHGVPITCLGVQSVWLGQPLEPSAERIHVVLVGALTERTLLMFDFDNFNAPMTTLPIMFPWVVNTVEWSPKYPHVVCSMQDARCVCVCGGGGTTGHR